MPRQKNKSENHEHEHTVEIRLVQDLRFDDLFNDVLQRDQTQNLVERISFTLVIHLLNDGQVGLTCAQRNLS